MLQRFMVSYKLSNQNCVCLKFQSVYVHWDELLSSGNSKCPPTMIFQGMLQNSSTLGRLGAVTLAQKLVKWSGV